VAAPRGAGWYAGDPPAAIASVRARGPRRPPMDRARHEFLARAGLAGDQDGGVCAGNPRHAIEHRLERPRRPDDLLEHRGAIHLVPQHQILLVELLLQRPDLGLGPLLLTQVEYECDAFLAAFLEQRTAGQHGDAAAVLPEELLLIGLYGRSGLDFGHRAFVALAPFRRRQLRPPHRTRQEIVTAVLDHAEKRIVRLENPTLEIPEADSDDVGVDQSPDL